MSESGPDGPADVDPRRALWRRGSYEVVGDWLRSASLSVLDAVEMARRAAGANGLEGCRLLDVATGTGTVAIEAARRGGEVVAVDLTDELVEIARARSVGAGVDIRFEIGDFDQLDGCLDTSRDTTSFDVVTSSFGAMFAPDAAATLEALGRWVVADGFVAVSAWHPGSAFMVPESMLDLIPERPPMPDMARWATGIAGLADVAGLDVVSTEPGELFVPFASVATAAEEIERWAGGWAQLLEMFDAIELGGTARALFIEHLESFISTDSFINTDSFISTDSLVSAAGGVVLRADYWTSVLTPRTTRAR